MDGINKSMYDIASDSAFSILARTNELKSKGKDVINLCIGQPDFSTPKNIVDAACKALRDGHHGYTASSGLLKLRESVASDLFKRNKVIVEPDQILISPGAKAIIFYTLLMFGQPGVEVITPDPGFMAYKSLIDYTGAKPVFLPHRKEQNFSFNVDELLSLITKKTRLIILNSPGNPTGGVVPEKEFDKLADELSKYPNIFILSDEIYSKITFNGCKHKTLLAYPQIKEQVIMMDGWSKSYAMTGWRLGYGIYPKKLFKFAEKLAINCHSCVNTATQIAGIEALENKLSQNFVEYMVRKFQERKDFMVSKLNEIKNIECCNPEGAFYVFPKISKKNFNSSFICSELLEKKFLATVPGSSFGKLGEGFLRISYASDMKNLKKSITLLKEYMNE
tara:strand:+ start:1725 stop:2900 length:1176 start_codon:yes stop_codon:yes gene_type:complete